MEDYKRIHERAISIAKYFVELGHLSKEDAEEMFPELKESGESDDERIRKGLINTFSVYYKDEPDGEWDGKPVKDIIAWLEKQGEQKPTDKVEPKFKVGDWVIDKQGIAHQIANVIENVTNHTYSYDIIGGGYFNDNTEGVRLWTIQDAKDGDVLATDNGGICIFDGTVEEGKYPFAYCGVTERGFESYCGKLPFTHANAKPATKEQRDLLFTKMKEAGYDWDSKKKELKKIETNPTWCEEDEEMIKGLNNCLSELEEKCGWRYTYVNNKDVELDKIRNWLKSLKERMKRK